MSGGERGGDEIPTRLREASGKVCVWYIGPMTRRKLKPQYIYLSDYHSSCMCESISATYITKARISKIGMREVAYVRYERGSIRVMWADAQREAELRRDRAQRDRAQKRQSSEEAGAARRDRGETGSEARDSRGQARRDTAREARRNTVSRPREESHTHVHVLRQERSTCTCVWLSLSCDTCTAALCLLCMCSDRRQRQEAAARALTSSGSRGETSGDT
jgi:hypothetical protein